MLGSQIEACKPPWNDLKMTSAIEMTIFYDAKGLFWSLSPKKMINFLTQSALGQICMGKWPVPSLGIFFVTFSWSV